MLNALTTINQQKSASVHFSREHRVYYINESGQKTEVPAVVIKTVTSPIVQQGFGFQQVGGIQYFGAYERQNGRSAFVPDWTELQRQATILDSLITPLPRSSYRNIMDLPAWQQIYKPAVTTRQKWNWQTNSVETVDSTNLYACRHCGVILDKEQIEIDHQRSKTIGKDTMPEANLWGATLKLFRYAGLTTDSATGYKAQKLGYSGASSSALGKYQLNDSGIFIFSLLVNSKSDIDIQNSAETSIPNLRPLCGGCNKRDGEPHTGLPWNKK
jgi:5-methylcytosine-specific restriction endonuclease McrA